MMARAKSNRVYLVALIGGLLGAGAVAYHTWAAEPQASDAAADSFKRLQLEMTQKELIQVQADLRRTQLERDFWKAREETFATLPIPNSVLEERLSQDPAIAKGQRRVTELKEEVAGLEGRLEPGKAATVVKNARTQLATAERSMETLKQALRQQASEQLRAKALDEYKGKLTQFQEQIDFLSELEKALKTEVQRLTEETRQLKPADEQRLSILEKELRELKTAVAELKKGK
jgi:hypothetical protein